MRCCPLSRNQLLLFSLQEAAASELASRMTAMKQRSDNAKEHRQDAHALELQQNAPPAAITQEYSGNGGCSAMA